MRTWDWIRLLAGVALAAVPWAWILTHRGARGAVERWIASNPPGSRTPVYLDPANPGEPWGLAFDSPISTVTARGAARQSLTGGLAAAALFTLGRIVVGRRRRRVTV